MQKGGFIYILTNKNKTTLYIGVTNDVVRRVYEHKTHLYHNSFTDKYNLDCCIYYEVFESIEQAIDREKYLKKLSRENKEKLINSFNPNWDDLDLGVINCN